MSLSALPALLCTGLATKRAAAITFADGMLPGVEAKTKQLKTKQSKKLS